MAPSSPVAHHASRAHPSSPPLRSAAASGLVSASTNFAVQLVGARADRRHLGGDVVAEQLSARVDRLRRRRRRAAVGLPGLDRAVRRCGQPSRPEPGRSSTAPGGSAAGRCRRPVDVGGSGVAAGWSAAADSSGAAQVAEATDRSLRESRSVSATSSSSASLARRCDARAARRRRGGTRAGRASAAPRLSIRARSTVAGRRASASASVIICSAAGLGVGERRRSASPRAVRASAVRLGLGLGDGRCRRCAGRAAACG